MEFGASEPNACAATCRRATPVVHVSERPRPRIQALESDLGTRRRRTPGEAPPRSLRRRPSGRVRGRLHCPTSRPTFGWEPINRASGKQVGDSDRSGDARPQGVAQLPKLNTWIRFPSSAPIFRTLPPGKLSVRISVDPTVRCIWCCGTLFGTRRATDRDERRVPRSILREAVALRVFEIHPIEYTAVAVS